MVGESWAVLLVNTSLLPATVGMGMLFPLFVRVTAQRNQSVGIAVGNTSAASTVGAIAGSIGGAAALTAFGDTPSLLGGLALYACLGTVVLARRG